MQARVLYSLKNVQTKLISALPACKQLTEAKKSRVFVSMRRRIGGVLCLSIAQVASGHKRFPPTGSCVRPGMDGTIASSGHRLYMMSQDLAFVEQRLIRAMAESQWDQSLTHALNKLRELREMVAAIQAMHTEVTSVWSSITAAARDQACCLRYIRTLKTAAEASESCTHPSEGLSAAGKEFSRSFCSKDFTVNAE
ncbi:uncharacterized protein LOC34618975 [Cyclospora cayetanensis]|uniref:Uncharacterized protein LOC34618975 n=1 Tax=Cyclospora cayetanensis TaxID=88456 RepID=A0A6P6RV39_9EIME|nr:uncharacterized protein LOC34618975 [Cyclospora cayetanensis]